MRLDELRHRFQSWLIRQPDWSPAVVTALRPVEGGVSNLTFRATLSGAPASEVALRLQREHGIFEPYDVLREARVLRALASSSVPVPGVLAVEPDPAPLGAPFAVLEWVDAPHMGVAGAEADFGAYVATVVRIHELDWRGAGLEFLVEREDVGEAVRGAVERVAARAEAWGLGEDRELSRAEELLRDTVPEDGELTLCQGDINVFNYLFRAGRVVAVVDWEQAAIADPRLDVGQILALSHLKGAPWGSPERSAFVQEYVRRRRRPLAGLSWFRAYWLWQLAVIYEGWVRSNESPPWYGREAVRGLLRLALEEVEA